MTSSVLDRAWAPVTFPAYTPTVANVLQEGSSRDLLRVQLSSYKVPRHVFFLTDADAPWLVSQKVDWRGLCDMAQNLVAQA